MEYKKTLNLPQTNFPMRAGLVQREPERLAKWYAEGLYEQIQKRREGAERFLLHDGPPFANGDVHIGTALNKILKDFILKYQTLRGKHVPYVPGWDCHGLPIELKVLQARPGQERGASLSTACGRSPRESDAPHVALARPQEERTLASYARGPTEL